MKVPIVVKIGALTLASTAFYTYVGQLVPQKEVQPPAETKMSADDDDRRPGGDRQDAHRGQGDAA